MLKKCSKYCRIECKKCGLELLKKPICRWTTYEYEEVEKSDISSKSNVE